MEGYGELLRVAYDIKQRNGFSDRDVARKLREIANHFQKRGETH